MNPREWFVLGIRLFGIWMVTRAATYLTGFVDYKLGLIETTSRANPTEQLLFATSDLALAAYFLFGARHLAPLCESDDRKDSKGSDPLPD